MIDVIRNTKTSQSKSVMKQYMKPISFRPIKEVAIYMSGMYDKSKFINRAISFYMMMINRPIDILKELKSRYHRLYKLVGRRRFK